MTSSETPEYLVFALRPESVLDEAIREAKSKTKYIAGHQIYLDHPPHLTLYVASFANAEAVCSACQELTSEWSPTKVSVTGWHHFSGDVLTGNQTLTCNLSEASKTQLRARQAELIATIHAMRSRQESLARYKPFFSSLSIERQQAVEEVGFPFVKNDWIPHFTIASITQHSWPNVWQTLENKPIVGDYSCDRLSIFRLVDDFPTEFKEFSLKKKNDLSPQLPFRD